MASPISQPSIKPNFWRIRNIKSSERDATTEWLQQQVKELELSEGQGFSLAADGEQTLCATLTSGERPTPSKRSWRVDKDFIGFTPLNDPEDANVDIVAITGLGGHALGSFRSKDGMYVWLRDFAPEDIPQARFITYGYDTTVTTSDSNQGIRELAHTLLDGLADFRLRTQTQERLLLFVCHSLGGVVLKEALVISSRETEWKYRALHRVMMLTYGLVLMGVPNLGLGHRQLGTVVKGRPNEGFIRDLQVQSDGEASQFLSSLTREFSYLDKHRRPPFEIVSYYETMSSPTMILENGIPLMNGPKEFIVTKSSAERIGHLARDISHLPSHADHRDLVRFDHPLDGRYISVIEKVKRMLAEKDTSLERRDREAGQGLVAAETQNHESDRSVLVSHARSLETSDNDGESAILASRKNRHTDCVGALIKKGATIDSRDANGQTMIMHASSNVHTKCVKALLMANATLSIQGGSGQGTLHMSARKGQAGCLELLLHAKSHLDLVDEDGCTPLMSATRYGHIKCVEILVAAGASIDLQNSYGRSAVRTATSYGRDQCLQKLLELNASVDLASRDGLTPLMSAAHHGHIKCVEVLIAAGASLCTQARNGYTAVSMAAFNGQDRCLQKLLELKAPVDLASGDGSTPLMSAVRNGHIKCVEVLIAAGASLDLQANNGWTPLHFAAAYPQSDKRLLLKLFAYSRRPPVVAPNK